MDLITKLWNMCSIFSKTDKGGIKRRDQKERSKGGIIREPGFLKKN